MRQIWAGGLAAFSMAGAALAEVPGVVADIAPVHGLVARVMEGVGEPVLIVRPGQSEHGHALRPSEAAALQAADLVVWMGPALTPWMQDVLGDATRLTLLEAPATRLLPLREGAVFETGHHADEDEGAHDHNGIDPHAWLDPENARAWLPLIAEELARLDPEHAATYRENAAGGAAEIDAAAARIETVLASARGRPFVVFHDAYHYFEARFGIEAAAAIALGDASAPGAARLRAVRDAIREEGAACVFAEPQFPARLLETVTEGSEVRTGILDPVGAEIPTGPGQYPALLEAMAGAMAGCLTPTD